MRQQQHSRPKQIITCQALLYVSFMRNEPSLGPGKHQRTFPLVNDLNEMGPDRITKVYTIKNPHRPLENAPHVRFNVSSLTFGDVW